jgi:phytoene synthase
LANARLKRENRRLSSTLSALPLPNRMTHDRHSPAPGSSAYYVLRFAPRRQRPALRALYEIAHAMDSVHRDIADPGVAQAKLGWWHDEISRAAQGSAQHPVVQRLQAQLDQGAATPLVWRALQGCVAAAESDAQQSRYLDEPALLRQVRASAHSLAEAAAAILAPDGATAVDAAGATASAVALVQLMRNLGRDARRGYLYVPIDDLQRCEVKAHEILQLKAGLQDEPRFQALMQRQAERARGHLQDARARLADQPRDLRRVLAALLAHNIELLGALEAAHFGVLNQHISLTPLRKLWLTWTAR